MGMAKAGFEIGNALPDGAHDPVARVRKLQVQSGNVRHAEVRQVGQGTAPRIEKPLQMIPYAQVQVLLRRSQFALRLDGGIGCQYVENGSGHSWHQVNVL